jgi:ATP-dependent Lhr-like helicase
MSTLEHMRDWFRGRGWEPLAFQEEAWAAYTAGRSGVIHVPTGAGKTYAATLAALADIADRGGTMLYISPLRAMSRDVEAALRAPIDALGLPIRVESRTGDTPSHARARQKRRPPEVLVTTPESLSLLLCEPQAADLFRSVRAVVVDEWHELVDSKRGTQVVLALGRLRRFSPGLRTWALTATLGNVEEAARAVVAVGDAPVVVRADLPRPIVLRTLLPEDLSELPWAGHLGITMLPRLLDWLDPAISTLIFCNTRAQAELWYQEIARARPTWIEVLGLHHGSMDREVREDVEAGLKDGRMRIVVCTASLDLGVDLAPVERVAQIGSPKGIARLMQRAGRSGHRPGAACLLVNVPTHALQLVEVAGAREALARGEVEPRTPLSKPLDVLAQHLVTCALGGGFTREDLLAEVREAGPYADLTDEEFDQALSLVRDGGGRLGAYPEFRKVVEEDGRLVVRDGEIARMHRANVGTITGDATVSLRYFGGGPIGTIDEGFVSRLRAGERFVFAGRVLEFVQMRDLVAWARPARKATTNTPHWPGTKLPISGSLGLAVRRVFAAVRAGAAQLSPAWLEHPELAAARGIFETQARLSRLPSLDAVLAETCETPDGFHLFLFPFEGRRVHEGLAALLATRMTRARPGTLSMAVNDHGLEFLSTVPYPFEELLTPSLDGPPMVRRPDLFTEEGLVDDIVASVNLSELSRRRFRDVARVAGLVRNGVPGAPRKLRQVQSSAGLLFDVFARHDPANPLLLQARREVLQQHFEQTRLVEVLGRLRAARIEHVGVPHPTPLSFPLVIERLSVDSASTESLAERVAALRARWERA